MSRVKLRTWHSDCAGWKASQKLIPMIGERYFHPSSGGLYVITKYAFDSERERWMIGYRLLDDDDDSDNCDFEFYHLPEDFLREGRFLKVKVPS